MHYNGKHPIAPRLREATRCANASTCASAVVINRIKGGSDATNLDSGVFVTGPYGGLPVLQQQPSAEEHDCRRAAG
jgi:hypothetical protein